MRPSSRSLLAVLATVFLIGSAPSPASAATAGPDGEATVQVNCRACNGYRYQNPNEKEVYLVIDGIRHHVPTEATYLRLWRDFSGLHPDGAAIDLGLPLIEDSFLAREDGDNKVFLVGRLKRWVPTEAIFNQYAFDWGKVQVLRRGSLDVYPDGPGLPGRS